MHEAGVPGLRRKRGLPVRAIETLLDANHAITQDLPVGLAAAAFTGASPRKLLLAAAESGELADITAVTDALLGAVEREGWMERMSLA